MKDFEYERVNPRRTLAIVFVAVLLSYVAASANDLGGGAIFLSLWAMFALGWLCVFAARKETARERLAWEAYEENDWRHFEQLQELSGAELEELRAVSKTHSQRDEALDWLIKRFDLERIAAEKVHDFFVRSNWANCGVLSDD